MTYYVVGLIVGLIVVSVSRFFAEMTETNKEKSQREEREYNSLNGYVRDDTISLDERYSKFVQKLEGYRVG